MTYGIRKPDQFKGEKEHELIKLREILKIHLAVIYLMSLNKEGCDGKSRGEYVAEWLLNDVVAGIYEHGCRDETLLQRVEALKDFYLVFVGEPLPLTVGAPSVTS